MTETTPTRRFGFKRWIVIALILVGIYLGFIVGGIFKPVAPGVVLPGEPIWPGVGLTNTLLATFLADLVLLWLGWSTVSFMRSRKLVPSGVYHIVELLVEELPLVAAVCVAVCTAACPAVTAVCTVGFETGLPRRAELNVP